MPTFVFHRPIVVCNGLLVITPRSVLDGFRMRLKSTTFILITIVFIINMLAFYAYKVSYEVYSNSKDVLRGD